MTTCIRRNGPAWGGPPTGKVASTRRSTRTRITQLGAVSRALAALTLGALAGCRSAHVAPNATLVSPQSAQGREILAVAERLFHAMRTKDSAEFRDVFEPSARLVGMRVRAGGDTVVQVLPWERFRDIALADTRGEWIERAWSPEIRVRGSMATVWAEYDFHFGTRASHCGVDAVQLLRTVRGWKIVSIADTYEPSGCPARPVPDTTRR